MGRKSKKKKTSRKPPLSLLDKWIYYLLIAASFIGSLLLIFFWDDLRGVIAFRDPSVIAYHGHASALLAILLVLYLEISGLVFFIVQLTNKRPIFGNSKIKYGQLPWDKDCFPLFDSRRKNVTVKPSEKRLRRNMRFAWCIGLLIVLAISSFSLCGRDCLRRDNSIISYNMINRQTDILYSEKDYSHLTLYATHVSVYRGGSYWKYGITIVMSDGKEFSFSNRDFDWREDGYKDNCLEKMLEIKELFPMERITIIGKNNVDKAASFIGLNEEQTQLLHSLFSS